MKNKIIKVKVTTELEDFKKRVCELYEMDESEVFCSEFTIQGELIRICIM